MFTLKPFEVTKPKVLVYINHSVYVWYWNKANHTELKMSLSTHMSFTSDFGMSQSNG